MDKFPDLHLWICIKSNLSGVFPLGQESGTVVGSSYIYVNAFKIGFDARTELSFLLDSMKDLNEIGLKDHYWEFNSNKIKIVVV